MTTPPRAIVTGIATDSARIRSRTRPSEAAGIEVDVTPVMNMFLILVPFLVSMAVFSHLAVHQFELPNNDPEQIAREPEELPLTLTLEPDRVALVRGDQTLGAVTAGPAGRLDYSALAPTLQRALAAGSAGSAGSPPSAGTSAVSTVSAASAVKAAERVPEASALQTRIIVAVQEDVVSQSLIECLDFCRSLGIEDIGLAEGSGR